MTVITLPSGLRVPIRARHNVRNGEQPKASLQHKIAARYNNVYGWHRKLFGAKGLELDSLPAGQAGSLTTWRNFVRTGRGTTTGGVSDLFLRFDMILAPGDNALASDPRCNWDVGGTNTDVLHYSRIETGSLTPDMLFPASIRYRVDADTEYELALEVGDYLRPVSCAIYEEHGKVVDDAGTSLTPRVNPDQEITDDQHVDLLANGHDLWKNNAAPLLWWSVDSDPDNGGDAPVITSATNINVFDSTKSAWGGNNRGWKTQAQYRNPLHTDDLVCVLAICAKHSAGADGTFDLHNSAGSLGTITSFGTSPEWKTTTVSLNGANNIDKVDLLAKRTAGSLTLYAVALYPLIT